MADDDKELDVPQREFRLITNVRQLATPPKLRHVFVDLEDWSTETGEGVRFRVCEMNAADYTELADSGWTYKNGVRTHYDEKDSDFRFLASILRDPEDNRLWNNVADAKAFFGKVGRGDVLLLIQAGNRVNSPKEGAKAGNSEEIGSVS